MINWKFCPGPDLQFVGLLMVKMDLDGLRVAGIGEAKATLREVKMLAKTLREDPSLLIHGVKQDGVKIQ